MKKGIKYSTWGLMLCVCLVSGCSKELATPDNKPDQGGSETVDVETVPVKLVLDVAKMLNPLTATSAGSSDDPMAAKQTGAMKIKMIEDQDQTSKAVDESTIANIWILQYDGLLPTSKLVYKHYFETYTATDRYPMAEVDNGRVVVIANSYDQDLVTDVVGTGTYQTQLDRAVTVTGESSLFANANTAMPMSADVEVDITDSDEAVKINLRRNVAHVIMRVKLGDNRIGQGWTVQMAGVPNKSYWMPHRTDPTFPVETPTETAYATQQAVLNMTDYVEFSWYVPVNRRGKVPGTVPFSRVTKAPKGATVVVIKGDTDYLSKGHDVTYTIHLGANFSIDYNIAPNHRYIYQIDLYSISEVFDLTREDDDRVTQTPWAEKPTYVGRFGGELVKTGAGADAVFQFSKLLYITTDNQTSVWSIDYGDHSALAGKAVPNYSSDGRGNTWRLNRGNGAVAGSLTDFPAANSCFKKNSGYESFASMADVRYKWFLPAHTQIAGFYMIHHKAEHIEFWTSTELHDEFACALGSRGLSGGSKAFDGYVRCVREI